MPHLEVHNLSIAFRGQHSAEPVVKGVSFALKKGEMLALVGESGSGKSVTALALMQLHSPHLVTYPSGSIRLDGEELMGMPDTVMQTLRGKRMGMVFQEPMTALNPLHTIGRQLEEVIRLHKTRPEKDIPARVGELLDRVGLSSFRERLDAYPHQLSGGERQRIIIAMAIANDPDILIADEPTTALDVTIAHQIMALIAELKERLGMAVLLITHDLNLVRRTAEHVAVMKNGEIVEAGETEQVFSQPEHPYTRHLIASVPQGSPPPLPSTSTEILSCDGLKVWFPVKKSFFGTPLTFKKAVANAHLSLSKGESLGIVGESGSGKTTLGLALLRLIASEGKIIFSGQEISHQPVSHLRKLRQKMQFVFQDPFGSLNPRMSIEEIIGEGLRVHAPALTREQRREKVLHALAEVGLEAAMADRYPHEFSGGQRQRIAIARAMILKPELVVFDEPTSALDVSLQVQIVDLLRELQRKHGTSYLFISHDLRVVKALCHRMMVLKDGVVVEEGTSERITSHPEHPYTRSLMEAAL